MIRGLIICCLAAVDLMTALPVHGCEKTILNADAAVVKTLGREPLTKGSFEELLKKNKIETAGGKLERELLKRLGFDPAKIEHIEGYTFNRWSVRRVRVSPNYELLIQFGMSHTEEYLATKVAVIPYRNKKMQHNLSNDKNWSSVIFE